MNKQEYIAPRAELIVVKAQLMKTFSDFGTDEGRQGDVVDDDGISFNWGDND